MDALLPAGISGLVAGILTYCDLASLFDAPPQTLKWKPWFRLQAWWWGFILANAILAGILYAALRDREPLKGWNTSLGAFAIGACYTTLVRLKVTTIEVNGKNTLLGLEAIYEAVKGIVHKRINSIVRVWRIEQCAALAKTDLPDLRDQALLMIGSDALMTAAQRNSANQWIDQITNNSQTSEPDKKRALALYIITEQRPTKS